MRRHLSLLFLCITSVVSAFADTTDVMRDTNVPFLDIRTVGGESPSCEYVSPPEGCWGKGIANATKVPARMVMTLRGDTIYDSGEYKKGESGLTIKIRGNASAYLDKKGYKLKLQKKADLLRRGNDKLYKDKDWVLLATNGLKYSIGLVLGEALGQPWTPASEFVAVRLNDEYLGLYNLAEQVKAGSGSRVNIDEEEGYMVEADLYWWVEDRWFDSSLTVPGLKYTFKYPDPDEITESQFQYVREDMGRIEDSVADGTFESAISCDSFARWLIGWDILGGGDAGGSNMFLVKRDAASALEMGPLWDFDSILLTPSDWAAMHKGPFIFPILLNSSNGAFRRAFVDMWNERGPQAISTVKTWISQIVDSDLMPDLAKIITLERPGEKDFTNEDWYEYEVAGFIEERDTYLSWMEEREKWISDNISMYDDDSYSPAIDEADAPALYYDLHGNLLSQPPANGLYIERKGGVVRKKIRIQ